MPTSALALIPLRVSERRSGARRPVGRGTVSRGAILFELTTVRRSVRRSQKKNEKGPPFWGWPFPVTAVPFDHDRWFRTTLHVAALRQASETNPPCTLSALGMYRISIWLQRIPSDSIASGRTSPLRVPYTLLDLSTLPDVQSPRLRLDQRCPMLGLSLALRCSSQLFDNSEQRLGGVLFIPTKCLTVVPHLLHLSPHPSAVD